MFDIAFTSDEPEVQEDGWLALWGRLTLGTHAEEFLAPLAPWSRADYERQWIEAARRLLDGADRTAFFTAAWGFWWAMWRDGEDVYVQEEMLTLERMLPLGPSPDLSRAPYELLGPRRTETEDGDPVSEWRLGVADVRAFVARRAGEYLRA